MIDDDEDVSERGPRPSKGVALLLALVGPVGIGQFYSGQTQRALLWLLVPAVFFNVGALALPVLGGALGYGLVFGVLMLGLVGWWLGSLVDLLRTPAERVRQVGGGRVFGYWALGLLFTLGVRGTVRGLLIEAFKIPSGSMQPALLVDDHIIADKLTMLMRQPKRGEAIIFKFPEQPEADLVNRAIALPGDTLEVKGGHAWLNGWQVPHCLVGRTTLPAGDNGTPNGDLELEFLDGEAYLVFLSDEGRVAGESQGPYTVGPGEFWTLGDNRNDSLDSRLWFGGRGGGVPFSHVKGRALFRWLSFLGGNVDWSRYGTSVAEPLLPSSMKSLESGLKSCLARRPPRTETVPPGSR